MANIISSLVIGGLMLILDSVIVALLATGKAIKINIKHTTETISTPVEPVIITTNEKNALDKQTEELNKNRPTEPVNMDGVIAAVNQVMGIDLPENEQKENN